METAGWVLALIGLGAGMISGFFGLGGGLVIVPALVYFAGFSQHRATGTSLAVLLLPVGIGAVFTYYRHGNVDIRAASIIAVCFLAAAWGSGVWANRVSAASLKLAFGLFVMAVGAYIVWSSWARGGR